LVCLSREKRTRFRTSICEGKIEKTWAKGFGMDYYLLQTAAQRNVVVLSQARLLFSQGKFLEAAQAFSQTKASFEEVVLDFIDCGQTDALRSYISAKFDSLRKTASNLTLDPYSDSNLT
jgi:hypothetical protein